MTPDSSPARKEPETAALVINESEVLTKRNPNTESVENLLKVD